MATLLKTPSCNALTLISLLSIMFTIIFTALDLCFHLEEHSSVLLALFLYNGCNRCTSAFFYFCIHLLSYVSCNTCFCFMSSPGRHLFCYLQFLHLAFSFHCIFSGAGHVTFICTLLHPVLFFCLISFLLLYHNVVCHTWSCVKPSRDVYPTTSKSLFPRPFPVPISPFPSLPLCHFSSPSFPYSISSPPSIPALPRWTI